ncbi:hypothetical protein J2W98_003776 [Paenibacillus peoriae]|uniref:Pullulanase n=1 Tax=Paenibacillus peoriae TaxID=59893 RepID=A0ABU1QIM2_9BACL|nr:hypothetical protein [Paenibacillus peoriae]MDR6779496.1 hypothetical protein [Paenibacillus peoriae]
MVYLRYATVKKEFLSLFLYQDEIEDDYVEVDEDCLCTFDEGTKVEILKEVPIGEYAEDQKSYVIFNPLNKESITLAASFLDFDELEGK